MLQLWDMTQQNDAKLLISCQQVDQNLDAFYRSIFALRRWVCTRDFGAAGVDNWLQNSCHCFKGVVGLDGSLGEITAQALVLKVEDVLVEEIVREIVDVVAGPFVDLKSWDTAARYFRDLNDENNFETGCVSTERGFIGSGFWFIQGFQTVIDCIPIWNWNKQALNVNKNPEILWNDFSRVILNFNNNYSGGKTNRSEMKLSNIYI